jgi:hypothetical protein
LDAEVEDAAFDEDMAMLVKILDARCSMVDSPILSMADFSNFKGPRLYILSKMKPS